MLKLYQNLSIFLQLTHNIPTTAIFVELCSFDYFEKLINLVFSELNKQVDLVYYDVLCLYAADVKFKPILKADVALLLRVAYKELND